MVNRSMSEVAPQAAARSFWSRGLIQVFSIGLMLAIVMCGWGYSRTGSAALVAPFLRGERLFVQPLNIDLGERSVGEIHELSIEVLNTSNRAVSILGAQKECGCLTVDEFPLSIEAGAARKLRLDVALPLSPAAFEQRVKYFTDHADRSQFFVTVHAAVK